MIFLLYRSQHQHNTEWIETKRRSYDVLFNIEYQERQKRQRSNSEGLESIEQVYLSETEIVNFEKDHFLKLWKKQEKFIESLKTELAALKKRENLENQKKKENYGEEWYKSTKYQDIITNLIGSDDDENDENNYEDSEFLIHEFGSEFCKQDYPRSISFMDAKCISEADIFKIINRVLLDLDIKDLSKYVSKRKVHETIIEYGNNILEEHSKHKGFYCFEIDGRKDLCLSKNNKKKRLESISVIAQPGSQFVDIFRPLDGKAETQAFELKKITLETESENTLRVVKFDGCKYCLKT